MRKKKLREAKVLQQEAELGFNPSLWSFPVTVWLLSEKNKQCEGQSWECAHHVLWAVNGPVRLGEWWVLKGVRTASTSPGCSCPKICWRSQSIPFVWILFGCYLSLAEHKGLVIHLPLAVISPPLRAMTLYLVPTFCLAFSWCWGSEWA